MVCTTSARSACVRPFGNSKARVGAVHATVAIEIEMKKTNDARIRVSIARLERSPQKTLSHLLELG